MCVFNIPMLLPRKKYGMKLIKMLHARVAAAWQEWCVISICPAHIVHVLPACADYQANKCLQA